jgi:hypothetical protein
MSECLHKSIDTEHVNRYEDCVNEIECTNCNSCAGHCQCFLPDLAVGPIDETKTHGMPTHAVIELVGNRSTIRALNKTRWDKISGMPAPITQAQIYTELMRFRDEEDDE